MKPVTIPNPSPGKHTIRIPLDPQPVDYFGDSLSEQVYRALFIEKYAPFTPGESYWVRERVYIDHFDVDDRNIPSERPGTVDDEMIYYRADGDCCDQIAECLCASVGKPKWTMCPQWASRFTALCLSVDLDHGDGWAWRVDLEVTNTRSE